MELTIPAGLLVCAVRKPKRVIKCNGYLSDKETVLITGHIAAYTCSTHSGTYLKESVEV